MSRNRIGIDDVIVQVSKVILNEIRLMMKWVSRVFFALSQRLKVLERAVPGYIQGLER